MNLYLSSLCLWIMVIVIDFLKRIVAHFLRTVKCFFYILLPQLKNDTQLNIAVNIHCDK